MRYKNLIGKGSLRVNNSLIGETIENKVRRVVLNNEPITDGANVIYTEKKQGILPEYDVRRDKFDIAIDAMDLANRTAWSKSNGVLKKESSESVDNLGNGNASGEAEK